MKTNFRVTISAHLFGLFFTIQASTVFSQELHNGIHDIIVMDSETAGWLEIFANPMQFDCSCDEVIAVVVKPTDQENVYASDDRKLMLTIQNEQYLITTQTDECCYVKDGTYTYGAEEEPIDLPPAYLEIADEICACVNVSASGISADFKQLVVNADGDMEAFQMAMNDYAMEHPDEAEAESSKLIACSSQIEKCINDLGDRFKALSVEEDEETITRYITLGLENKEGCEFAHGLLVIGLQAK